MSAVGNKQHKESLKIDYADMWRDFDKENNFFYYLLSERYNLIISSDPELLIFSCFGTAHLKYNCAKLFYTGENRKTNFNACDYSISFENLTHKWQYQLPHYVIRVLESNQLHALEKVFSKVEAAQVLEAKEHFCCTVVSNPEGTVRNDFYDDLNRIKKVNSGGKFQNNVNGPVADKKEFCDKHKFVFAFENEKEEGYCTEKITDAFLSNAIPIYYGDPKVKEVFNEHRFINYDDYSDTESLIHHIMELDSDDEMYVDMMAQPIFKDGETPDFFYKENLLDFIIACIKHSKKNTPVSKTFRGHRYWLERKMKNLLNKLRTHLK
ncbi:hypothetical protein EAX61_11905 [Dokdonia sinensis]|uniref:Uncharacterized protein n=1 Tax=Dokdonia sinensis TaxID=2479847 RepID=A0A3M0FXP2_9FLAO|nr:glycosyltransferase family 10 [Dokdonia sinensis]RMB57444.1 hypothetical protein EAX61_11905 [Dokdonia sinensis]